MQSVDGHIFLSPSDLNDYVECQHLTTLALEVARGERARLHVADEEAELLRRKGAAPERAYLERLRAEGRTIIEIGPRRALGLRGRGPPDRGGHAGGR